MTEVEEMLNAVDEAIEAAEELNEVVAAEESEVAEADENGVAETDESGVAVLSAENSRAAADGSRLSTAKKKKAINLEDLIYIKKYIQDMVADAKSAADDTYYKKTDMVAQAIKASTAMSADVATRAMLAEGLRRQISITVFKTDGVSDVHALIDKDVTLVDSNMYVIYNGELENTGFIGERLEDEDTDTQNAYLVTCPNSRLLTLGTYEVAINGAGYDKIAERIEELEEQNSKPFNIYYDSDTGVASLGEYFEAVVVSVGVLSPTSGKSIYFGSDTQLPEGKWFYVEDDGTFWQSREAELYTGADWGYSFHYLMTGVTNTSHFYNLSVGDKCTIRFNYVLDKVKHSTTTNKLYVENWTPFEWTGTNSYSAVTVTVPGIEAGYTYQMRLARYSQDGDQYNSYVNIGLVSYDGRYAYATGHYEYLKDQSKCIVRTCVLTMQQSTSGTIVQMRAYDSDGTQVTSDGWADDWKLEISKVYFER